MEWIVVLRTPRSAAQLIVIRFEEKGGYTVNAVRGKVLKGLNAPVMELTERIEPAA